MEGEKAIKNFTDLIAWQRAHELALFIYRVTSDFPKEERYGLTSQMRRCVISVGSNIAEGFGRYGCREKIRFHLFSQGSIYELQNQLILARDVRFLSVEDFTRAYQLSLEVHKLLSGLMRVKHT